MLKHFVKNFIAGMIAMLPIVSTFLAVALIEHSLSLSGIAKLEFYFPGLGIIIALVMLYLVGLIATSFLGKYIWKKIDFIFERIPAIGQIYKAIKEILGYDTGDEAIFIAVVLYKDSAADSEEIGLVTREYQESDGCQKSFVYIPNSPTPTTGRLVIIESSKLKVIDITPHEAFKMILSVGKIDIKLTSVNNTLANSRTDNKVFNQWMF
jgi:uncharacterized membrane protein